MRRTRSRLAVGLVAAALAGLPAGAPCRAEVSAEVDALGNYVRTLVAANASARNVKIWAPTRSNVSLVRLNPDGDLRGDLWPEILESPRTGNLPWVVWSRFDGVQYDLAWSCWCGGTWTPPAVLDSDPLGADDLDPALAADSQGMVWAAWWRNEGGTGRVWLSAFLRTRWMVPFPVSDGAVDSRDVSLEILPDGTIQVTYLTPQGPAVRTLQFARPSTITDDINPFGAIQDTSTENLSR